MPSQRPPHRRLPLLPIGVALGLAYLVWRIGWTINGAPLWLGIPVLALEAFAVAQVGILAAATRHAPPTSSWETAPERSVDFCDITVVVDAGSGSLDLVRRTLVSLTENRIDPSNVVVITADDAAVSEAARLFGAVTRADGRTDRSAAFWSAALDAARPFAVWLDAGDVVTGSLIPTLADHFADSRVAVVQSTPGLLNPDSFVHLRDGRDEAAFERDVLAPALDHAGTAPWNGAGSMARLDAVAMIGGIAAGPGGREAATARLHADRWVTVHEPATLIRRNAPDVLDEYLLIRRRNAADRLRGGSLARPGRGWVGRMALADGHLRSIRQLGASVALIAVLVSGAAPVSVDPAIWASVALLAHGVLAAARLSLAGSAMRPGDWVREGWRSVGADLAGLFAGYASPAETTRRRGIRSLGSLRLLTATLLAIDVALLARAATLVRPDLLPSFSTSGRVVALAAGIACIVPMIDVLQVIVRRQQRRADHRLAASLSAVVDGRYCETIDISPGGLGLLMAEAHPVGTTLDFTLAVPRPDRSVLGVDMHGTVRHARPHDDGQGSAAGQWVVGLELGDLDEAAWGALFVYCAIVHPSGLDRQFQPEPEISPASLAVQRNRFHSAMGPVSLAAGMLAAVTMFFGPASGSAFASAGPATVEARVCVVGADGEPQRDLRPEMHLSGAWEPVGTTGRDGCVSVEAPAARTPVRVAVDGQWSRIDQVLGTDPVVRFAPLDVEAAVVVVDAEGQPVSGVEVETYGRAVPGWLPLGVTGDDGSVSLTAWPKSYSSPVRVAVDGQWSRIDQVLGTDPVVRFAPLDVEAAVVVVDAEGQPVSGVEVQTYRDALRAWETMGSTGDDGSVSLTAWPRALTPVRVAVDGQWSRIDQVLGTDPVVRFAPLDVEAAVVVVDAEGQPVSGVEVETYGRAVPGWLPLGVTGDDGSVSLTAWPKSYSSPVRVAVDGQWSRIDQVLGTDPVVRFAPLDVEAAVVVVDAEGQPVSGVEVQTYRDALRAWETMGSTGDDGSVSLTAWPRALTPVRVAVDGQWSRIDQVLGTDPVVRFAPLDVEAAVVVVDSNGDPVSGVEVETYGRAVPGWLPLGVTGDDGSVSLTAWPKPYSSPIRVFLDSRTSRIDQRLDREPLVQFELGGLEPDQRVEVAQVKLGDWVDYDSDMEFLSGALTVRDEDGLAWAIEVRAGARGTRQATAEAEVVEDASEVETESAVLDGEPELFVSEPEIDDDPDLTMPEPTVSPESSPTPTPRPTPAFVLDLPDDVRLDLATTPDDSGAGSNAPATSSEPGPTEPPPVGGPQTSPPLPAVPVGPPDAPIDTDDPPVESFDPAVEEGGTTADDELMVVIRPVVADDDSAAGVPRSALRVEVTNPSASVVVAPVVVEVDTDATLPSEEIVSGDWRCSSSASSLRCVGERDLEAGETAVIEVESNDVTADPPSDLAEVEVAEPAPVGGSVLAADRGAGSTDTLVLGAVFVIGAGAALGGRRVVAQRRAARG